MARKRRIKTSRERIRERHTAVGRQFGLDGHNAEVKLDMLPLLDRVKSTSTSAEEERDQIVRVMLKTEDLAEEPCQP